MPRLEFKRVAHAYPKARLVQLTAASWLCAFGIACGDHSIRRLGSRARSGSAAVKGLFIVGAGKVRRVDRDHILGQQVL